MVGYRVELFICIGKFVRSSRYHSFFLPSLLALWELRTNYYPAAKRLES